MRNVAMIGQTTFTNKNDSQPVGKILGIFPSQVAKCGSPAVFSCLSSRLYRLVPLEPLAGDRWNQEVLNIFPQPSLSSVRGAGRSGNQTGFSTLIWCVDPSLRSGTPQNKCQFGNWRFAWHGPQDGPECRFLICQLHSS